MRTFFSRSLLTAILACGFVAFGHAAALPFAADLQAAGREAQERRVPVLIAYTLETCPYCAAAKRDHLEPLRASRAWGNKAIFLEIDVASERPLRDFDGQMVTHRDFARRLNITRVPTVIVYEQRGAPVSDPIVGLPSSDFYQLYLEQAIEAGLAGMRYGAR